MFKQKFDTSDKINSLKQLKVVINDATIFIYLLASLHL